MKTALGYLSDSGLGDYEMRYQSLCSGLGDLIGCSPALGRVRELARQAAQDDASVLIVGERGTGKKLIAHAIHAASPRRHQPLVHVDCSIIPQERLEAKLFGNSPRAATGAGHNGAGGKIALGQEGTLFLDEIGEMPLDMQARLLCVLQERQLMWEVGVPPQPVRCAVIAASERDPETLVAQGRLRWDLWHRLDIVHITVPPLRERPEDIPLLLAYYWRRKSQELGRMTQLSAKALRVLETHPWPRNVCELIDVVERLLREYRKLVIEPEDLPEPLVVAAERWTLERVWRLAQGNRTKAAQLLGMTRASFYRKLRAHGLLDPDVV